MLTALPELRDCDNRSPYYSVCQHRHGRKMVSGVKVAAESLEQFDESLKAVIDGTNFLTARGCQWHGGFHSKRSIVGAVPWVSWVRNQMRTSNVNGSVEAFAKIVNESGESLKRSGKRVVVWSGWVNKTTA